MHDHSVKQGYSPYDCEIARLHLGEARPSTQEDDLAQVHEIEKLAYMLIHTANKTSRQHRAACCIFRLRNQDDVQQIHDTTSDLLAS